MPKVARIFALIVAFMAALGIAAFASSAVFAQQVTAAQDDERENAQENDRDNDRSAGAVFAMTNVTAGNRIVVYRRAQDGTLTRAGWNIDAAAQCTHARTWNRHRPRYAGRIAVERGPSFRVRG